MGDKQISQAVINRLPRYYRYLTGLQAEGLTRISSAELSERMGLTASQIRQDLNQFGCFGQQGYGYNIELLFNAINEVIGLDHSYNLIVIGAGNIGKALANYDGFTERGFFVKAMFDADPEKIGTKLDGIPILDHEGLEEFLEENEIDIAVLALPGDVAFVSAQRLFEAGVNNIWNFSNVDLHAPEEGNVVDVHLTDSLMTLVYDINKEK